MRKFFKVLVEYEGNLKEKWIEHHKMDEKVKFFDIVALLDATDRVCEKGINCNFCDSLFESIEENCKE